MTAECTACGSDHIRAVSPWLSRCDSCGLYRSALAAGPGQAFDGLEDIRRRNFELLASDIAKVRMLAGSTVLEVGCAKGWFLEEAKRRGAIVLGIEPVEPDAKAAEQAGLTVVRGLFPAAAEGLGPFDIIVFNDVFEHLPDPSSAARAAEDLLAPGGLLVINLPSSRGTIFKLATLMNTLGLAGPFERMWQKGLPSPHLSYFSPANLDLLVAWHTGLQQVRTMVLPTVSRKGLGKRLSSRSVGLPSFVVGPLIWMLSFALPLLPADIHVGMFQKRSDADRGRAVDSISGGGNQSRAANQWLDGHSHTR